MSLSMCSILSIKMRRLHGVGVVHNNKHMKIAQCESGPLASLSLFDPHRSHGFWVVFSH
jgi:hypothetical protein